MRLYHGTSSQIAQDLAAGRVDVTAGGGELGRGFYTGDQLHRAKSWALSRSGDKQKNVVAFDADDNHIEAMNYTVFDGRVATAHRTAIKRGRNTRTHTFGYDMVWSPIVGNDTVNSEQHKWESANAQDHLNSAAWPKTVI